MTHKLRRIALRALHLTVMTAMLSSSQAYAQENAEDIRRQLESLTPSQRAAALEALGQGPIVIDEAASLPEAAVSQPEPDIAAPDDMELDDERRIALVESEPGLKPFGYDLFAGEPTTFAPVTDIPVPSDYIIGPGDTVDVQLYGAQNAQYRLVVTREGALNFPEIGPISVAGLSFENLHDLLQQRISGQMMGVNASITMGPLRSIRIFVLGDAHRPGSYTVSSLSTMTNALFASGGISLIGSLRRVQLKRNGRLVATLDLYDLLLRGDTSGDTRLQPGDVIFIPPLKRTVGVAGEVRRPSIYELKNEKTVADIIRLSGGMLPSAFPRKAQLNRINDRKERTIIDLDLTAKSGMDVRVNADDVLTVSSVLDRQEGVVFLQGHVSRAGAYQWASGIRLTDIVGSLRDLKTNADLGYAMIRRESPVDGRVSVLSANIGAAFASAGGSDDIQLQPHDQITIFDLESDRQEFIGPLLDELRMRSSNTAPVSIVRIAGRVRVPGNYPLEDDMSVTDLIRAGGYLLESAYVEEAELARYEEGPDQARGTRLISVDLAAALDGDDYADIALESHDVLTIREKPLWSSLEEFRIEGEVRFPGAYPIRRGEKLSTLMERAGGLTDLAFPKGAIFLREDLRLREIAQLEELTDRLESELESTADSVSDIEVKSKMLDRIRDTEATGRLVIDLAAIAAGNADINHDIEIQNGDRLLIPRKSRTVTIIGEVQFPTTYVFEEGISRNGYVSKSGGITAQADKKRIYIVRADGSVVASSRSLFGRSRDMKTMQPGDTIVVPVKPDAMSTLAFWTSVTTIIYNIGVAAAAVSSF